MQLPEGDRYSMDKERMLNDHFGALRWTHRRRGVHEPDDHRREQRLRASHGRSPATWSRRYGMTDELGPVVYADNEGEVFLGRSITKTR